jgi:hypothetical protein
LFNPENINKEPLLPEHYTVIIMVAFSLSLSFVQLPNKWFPRATELSISFVI